MAITNHERVGKALELLKAGLGPFVEREMKSTYRDQAKEQVRRFLGGDRILADKPVDQWDVAALLKLMWDAWNSVFRKTLGLAERSLVSENHHAFRCSGSCGSDGYGKLQHTEIFLILV